MKTLIILFLLPLHLLAQDVTGIWTGFINTSEKKLPYELAISDEKGKLNGYSHTIFMVNGMEIISVKKVKVKNDNGTILVEDEDLIYDNFSNKAPKKVKQFNSLSYKKVDSGMFLSGTFNTNKTRELRPASGSIRLQKKDTSDENRIIPKLKEMDLLGTLSFLHPKEKGVLAVTPLPVIEEPAPVQQKATGIEVASAPVNVKQSSPVQPSKKITVTAPEPKPVEVPKDTIAAVEKKPVELPKPKQIAMVAPPVKKLPPLLQPKEKQVVAAKPPVVKQVPPSQPATKPVVIARIPPPKPIPTAAVAITPDLSARKIETIQGLFFKSDSLTLTLYDNGEVDGDTVSVIMNGKVIISKQGLSTNAFTKTINITPDLGDSVQLIMYAENLGSIPPNTGLLILQDGNDRYEIRFAGDLKKNAAITLKRKPL